MHAIMDWLRDDSKLFVLGSTKLSKAHYDSLLFKTLAAYIQKHNCLVGKDSATQTVHQHHYLGSA